MVRLIGHRIFCVLPTIGLAVSYWPKTDHISPESRAEAMKKVDFIGAGLSITGITLL